MLRIYFTAVGSVHILKGVVDMESKCCKDKERVFQGYESETTVTLQL